MTKLLTAVALLSTLTSFGQDMGISFDSKDVVRMDLWIFGVSADTDFNQKENRPLNEELKVAIDKITL